MIDWLLAEGRSLTQEKLRRLFLTEKNIIICFKISSILMLWGFRQMRFSLFNVLFQQELELGSVLKLHHF